MANIFLRQISGSETTCEIRLCYSSAQKKYDLAVARADAAAKIYLDNFGKHYDNYPTVLIAKGLSITHLGRAKDGEILLQEAVELRNSSLPAGHFWVAAAKGALGECLLAQKRFPDAERLLKQSYESLFVSQEAGSPRLEVARERLIALYRAIGRFGPERTIFGQIVVTMK